MDVLLGSLTMVEATCCNCYTHFGMDQTLYNRLQANGGTFWCPLGHAQHYTDTEIQRLKKQLKNANDRMNYAEQRAECKAIEAEEAKRSRTAIKGQLTKTRKRIVNGVCPCCHRTFHQLASHMQQKHPDFKETVS